MRGRRGWEWTGEMTSGRIRTCVLHWRQARIWSGLLFAPQCPPMRLALLTEKKTFTTSECHCIIPMLAYTTDFLHNVTEESADSGAIRSSPVMTRTWSVLRGKYMFIFLIKFIIYYFMLILMRCTTSTVPCTRSESMSCSPAAALLIHRIFM